MHNIIRSTSGIGVSRQRQACVPAGASQAPVGYCYSSSCALRGPPHFTHARSITLSSGTTCVAPQHSRRQVRVQAFQFGRSSKKPAKDDIKGQVLAIGVTGVTGRSALSGLLAGGVAPEQVLAVTRNPSGTAAQQLLAQGVNVTPGDLDDLSTLTQQLSQASFIYCHALSGDAASADPQELLRGKALAQKLAEGAAPGLKLLVYNSSAGRGSDAGISQMEQKHAVEDAFAATGVPFLGLGATMFMEEWWKHYTRPQILTKGTFPFSLPSNQPLQMVAARDLGLAAATAFKDPSTWGTKGHLALAGDSLTPAQMCEAFSAVQGEPVKHVCPPAWMLRFMSADLWRITMFLREKGYKADVAACREAVPGMLTFREFLEDSDWGNKELRYEDGIRFKSAAGELVA